MLSVIICTHNPQVSVLKRTAIALLHQTLRSTSWELIVVDNASKHSVERLEDIPWPDNVRHIVEPQPGLTAARLRGISESQAEMLIFVDDDNFLTPNYLHIALIKSQLWPQLGTFGGSISPIWEEPPEDWTKPYWNWLAIRELTTDLWSNVPFDASAHPYGAGICVRRAVAAQYLKEVNGDAIRLSLDRTADSLLGGGDADINFTAIKMGLGTGIFQDLSLEHWMPKERLAERYLLKLVEDMTYSHHLLCYIWGKKPSFPSRSQRLLSAYENCFIDARARRFEAAKRRGLKRAIAHIRRLDSENPTLLSS